MDEVENPRPIPRSRLSKTPSWITLGFVLGALFVLSLPTDDKTRAARKPVAEPPPVRLQRPQLLEIEAVFAGWGQAAIWHHDVTEVALWDTAKHAYSIYYEVLRSGDNFYFRSVPKLTRPILTHGVRVNSPLQFTETEQSRREWLNRGQDLPAPPTEESTDEPAPIDPPAIEQAAAEKAAADRAALEQAAADAGAPRDGTNPRPN